MYNKNHTKQSIRSDKERKDTVTSVRMSKDQKQKIQKNADKAGMPIKQECLLAATWSM